MGLTVGELNILLEGEVQDFLRELQRARSGLRRFENESEERTQRAGRSFRRLAGTFAGVGVAITAVAGAIAALGLGRLAVDAVQAESAFGQLLGQIQTLVGVSGAELAELREGVLAISQTTGRGPAELAAALFAVTSAGQRGAEALTTLELASQASAAGLGETRAVALAAVAATTAFAEQNLSTAQSFEVLLGTVREGNLEASQLSATLGQVLGPAAAVGASFSDVGAAVATFTRLGVSASQAVTGLRATLAGLLSPTTSSAAALEQVGLTTRGLRESIGEQGLARTLVDLVARFDALGPAGAELLADAIPSVEALAFVLGTAGAQAEEFIRINDELASSQGALESAFDTTTQRIDFQISRLTSSFDRIRIAIGAALSPGVASALSDVILPAFESFEEQIAANANQIAAFARDVIPALLSAFGGFLSVLGFVVRGFGLLIDSFRALRVSGAAVQEVIVFLVNGFETLRRVQDLLIRTSIAQFAALGAALRGNFGQAREIISGAIDEVRDFNLVTQEQVDRQLAARGVTRQAFAEFNAGTPLIEAAAAALERSGTAATNAGTAIAARNAEIAAGTAVVRADTDATDENTAAKNRNAAAGGDAAGFSAEQVTAQQRLTSQTRAIEVAELARIRPQLAQIANIEDQIAKLRALEAETGEVGSAEEAINALLREQARLRGEITTSAQATQRAEADVRAGIQQLGIAQPEDARLLAAEFNTALAAAVTPAARAQVIERFGEDLQDRIDMVTPPPLSEQLETSLRSGFRSFLEGDAPNIVGGIGNLLESRVFDSLENAFARSLDTFDQAFGAVIDGVGEQLSGIFDGLGGEGGLLSGLFGGEGGGGLGSLLGGLLPIAGAAIASAFQGTEVSTAPAMLDRGGFMQTEQAVRGIVSGGVDVPIFRVGQSIERANEGVRMEIRRQTRELVAAITGTGGLQPTVAAANLLEEESTTIA